MSRRLLLGYLGLTVLVLAVLEIPLAVTQARTAENDLIAKVDHDAVALGSLAQGAVRAGNDAQLRRVGRIAENYAEATGGRVVITNGRGRSLADTDPNFATGRNFATRPEFQAALAGRVSSGIRDSKTLGARLLYVAVPVASGGVVDGAVRVTYPTSTLDDRILRYRLRLLAIAGVVLAAATLIGLLLARSVTSPLHRLQRATAEVGRGDLRARAPVAGPPEVKELARAFNGTVAKLETLLHSQEQFVADASHELRTPLTALRLRLENLERDVPSGARDDLEAAADEAERLNLMVEDLLALARADASEAPSEPVDVAELVESRASAWEAFADERGVRVVAEPDGRPVARAGRGRLEQVVDNLLSNALDVSPSGTTVALRAASSPGTVEVHVVDEGPGMTAVDRERAFDRFWRGRSGGSGSGLGLAIVKRLVEADDGTVELREAAGGGLDAVVRLRSAG
ncbi:MAG TPA: ATP-binding protein [Gaiellaceae bacterium]